MGYNYVRELPAVQITSPVVGVCGLIDCRKCNILRLRSLAQTVQFFSSGTSPFLTLRKTSQATLTV